MKRILLALSLSFFSLLTALAGRVDTLQISSAAMNKTIPCVLISPDQYTLGTDRFPVVYLLHGYGGKYSDWIKQVPELALMADRYGVMIVCPSGANSWYIDSPLEPSLRYETFVGTELPAYIDSHYRTLADRDHRAITGLSMGGHGALYLAIRHRDTFGQAGSLSGGVDIRPFPNNWEIKKSLGEIGTNPGNWERNTVINVADSLKNKDLRLFIDCGTADFFFEVNRNLHKKLLERGIEHDYIERPGAHTWAYWRENVEYHLLFFRRGFKK